jgi:hypothetical protein
MTSSYSPLKVELIGTGEQAGTWGTTTNTNLGTALEEAITGRATATFPTDANYPLPYIESNASQVFRNLVLNVTSSVNLSATRDLIVPEITPGVSIEKQYFVENNTSGGQSIRIKTATGTGVTIPNGKVANVYCDGINVRLADDFVGITGGTISGVTLSLSSPLGVTQGGTGLSTATQGDILYASASNTYVALPKNTTATRYLANTGTSNNPAWAQIDLTNGVINTLPVNRGGTGVASVTAGALLLGAGTSAFTTLTGTVTGQVVSWNNITATWEVGTLASGVSSFSAGTTGFTPSTGTTGAVTLSGTLNVANGGTGQTSYTNGQLLIGNSSTSSLSKATLTQGTGISITNGAGTITIATANPDVQTFNVNGTWTKPSAGTMARIQVWGGGGGGTGVSSSYQGLGGGGGGYNELWIPVSSLAATVSVTVGGSGSGSSSGTGGTGGTSSFGSHVSAFGGGGGGQNPSSGQIGPGGGGGQLSAGAPNFGSGSPVVGPFWSGGLGGYHDGGVAYPGGSTVFGGAGGGTQAGGSVGNGGTSVYGGNGGSGGTASGVAPGGGGAGYLGVGGGNGAAGRVIVTVF